MHFCKKKKNTQKDQSVLIALCTYKNLVSPTNKLMLVFEACGV